MAGTHASIKRNAALNMARQGCTILFPLISFVYSAHILGAASIGIYTFSQSIVSYFVLVAGLGISTYAIREGAFIRDDKEKFQSFVCQVFTINVASTCVAYALLGLLLITWTDLEAYRSNILLQSTCILLSTLGADWINQVYEDYLYLTVRYIAIQLIAIAFLFLTVHTPEDLLAYTVIMVCANSGGNIINWFYIRRYAHLRLTIRPQIKTHLLPSLVMFGNAVAVAIYVASDITILGIFADDQQVGIYSVSTKVYSLVKQLINAATIVTVPRFSYLLAKGDLAAFNRYASKTVSMILLLVTPLMLGVLLEGINVLYLFAGEEYLTGNAALQVLCFAMPFAVANCFIGSSIMVPNCKEKQFFVATAVAAVTNVGLNFVFIPIWGMVGAAWTTVIAELLCFIIGVFYSRGLVVIRLRKRDMATIAIGSIIVVIVCGAINCMGLSAFLALGMSFAISVVGYIATLVIGGNQAMRSLFVRIGKGT